MTTDGYRRICREVDSATRALGDANRMVVKAIERVVGPDAMRANTPTLVINGVERPQTIVFVGEPGT